MRPRIQREGRRQQKDHEVSPRPRPRPLSARPPSACSKMRSEVGQRLPVVDLLAVERSLPDFARLPDRARDDARKLVAVVRRLDGGERHLLLFADEPVLPPVEHRRTEVVHWLVRVGAEFLAKDATDVLAQRRQRRPLACRLVTPASSVRKWSCFVKVGGVNLDRNAGWSTKMQRAAPLTTLGLSADSEGFV